jgi:hypothetical protein
VSAGADCTAFANVDGGSYDPDNGDTIVTNQTPAGPYHLGTNHVTLTVIDNHGASNTCTATVVVVDTTAPIIVTCPQAITNSADVNCEAPVPNFLAGLVTYDNCTANNKLIITQTPTNGTFVGTGAHPITVSVVDAAGNSNGCTTSFIVIDTTAPIIVSCPAASTNSSNGSCQASVPNFLAGLVTYDNCTPSNALAIWQNPTNGTIVGKGTTPIAISVIDAAGNSNGCTTTFTVVDTTPPTIKCPSNVTAKPDIGKCTATVTYAPVVTDNCGATNACTPPSGSAFVVGTTTVVCTAYDAAGNSNTCSFTVTVGVGNKCPLSQGYWKNHPELWAVNTLTLGGVTYTKAQLLAIMNNSTVSDASIILAKQLIAALLNQANGSSPLPLCGVVADANTLLTGCNLPCNVNTKSTLGKSMLNDANTLEAYNLGKLTPSCTP